MFSGNSDCSLKAFELPPSVWKLILSFCPDREASEVRKVLGESLIEQTCDLHEEVSGGETFANAVERFPLLLFTPQRLLLDAYILPRLTVPLL